MTDLKLKKDIKSMIYEIRGKQVMLDSDLAREYMVQTKVLIQAVKRNSERFPENFMFQLTEMEYGYLRSQIVTSNKGGRRYMPYVFTEQGVAMLASILKSKKAINTSIQIINAFVAMRHLIGNNLLEQKYINNMVLEHDNEIKLLQECFDKFEEKELFLDKVYDAYSTLLDIFKSTKKELIIIDRYTDRSILDIIKDLECNVILITSNKTKIKELDIKKYKETYNNLKLIYDDTYHDRYFILDRELIYHSGNSINHIGYRKSSINILEDENIKEIILKDVERIIKKDIKIIS